MSEAPILILLAAFRGLAWRGGVARGPDGDPIILGLSLVRRAALAARRAGYGQVFLLRRKRSRDVGPAAIADWRSSPRLPTPAPLIIAPAAILAETDWLERLASTRIEPAAWGAIPNRIVMLSAASALAALDALDIQTAARGLADVEGRLARVVRAPGAPSRGDRSDACRDVRRRSASRNGACCSALVKDTDGFMARHVERPISLADFAPPRGDRDHAQSDEPDLDCGRESAAGRFSCPRGR